MCRSTEIHGAVRKERDRLRFRAFYVRLSTSISKNALPETLSLLYLPRINGTLLDINDATIRPDSASYVALHWVRSASGPLGEAVFASSDRVRVCEGVRFEVYLKEERVLKGIFRKDEEGLWRLDCKCAMERELGVSEAEVGVAGERCGVVREKVEMQARRRNGWGYFGLEEIPEEREVDFDVCDCGESAMRSDGEGEGEDSEEEEERNGRVEMEEEEEELGMEGVRWAVDLGIWVMCLGLGILVSKASSKGDFWRYQTRRRLS
ncbi:hypothetical protein CKAN_01792600 [Cinnamomum micranthum f. kanehirae]|uniref:Uncharacterized protein n=1 Tax=Cinnamomum micranthum f. kanehirae TaxID=337451 RepID=A0A443PDQ5_9MAGN|nr:hypothetical protein CKAN_01792600 [Cinnamomum micranthum f. kanehirae]